MTKKCNFHGWSTDFALLIWLSFRDRSHRERENDVNNTRMKGFYPNITNLIKTINAPLTKYKPMKMESLQQLYESVVCSHCNGPHRIHINFSFIHLKHITIWLQILNFLFNPFLFFIFICWGMPLQLWCKTIALHSIK